MTKPPSISPSSLPTGPDTSASATRRKAPLGVRSPVLAHLRKFLFAGFLTAIPLFITLYIISLVYGVFTSYTNAPANWIVGHLFGDSDSAFSTAVRTTTRGTFALGFALLIVYILGLLGSFLIGRQILAQIEHFIENLPLIKGIYGTTKQVLAVFRKGGGGSGFQRVVLVQFPREGTWTVAIVTNTIHDSAVRPPTFMTPTATPDTTCSLPGPHPTGTLVSCEIPITPSGS